MKCSACGNEVTEGKKFCGYCGQKIDPTQSGDVTTELVVGSNDPEQSKSAKLPNRPRKRLKLGWIILVSVLIVAFLIYSGTLTLMIGRFSELLQKKTEQENAAEQLIETAPKPIVNEPEISPTLAPPTATLEPQEIRTFADVYYRCDETMIPAKSSIRVYFAWSATTPELVSDFYDAVGFNVFVDGKKYEILDKVMDDFSTSNDGYPLQRINLEIGILEPGLHEIKTIVSLSEKIFDGWDWYGPGENVFEKICTVNVERN